MNIKKEEKNEVKYFDDLKSRIRYLKKIKKQKKITIPNDLLKIFDKELKIIAAFYLLFIAFIYSWVFFVIYKSDIIKSLSQLGIPSLNWGYYRGGAIFYLAIVIAIFFAKHL